MGILGKMRPRGEDRTALFVILHITTQRNGVTWVVTDAFDYGIMEDSATVLFRATVNSAFS